MKKIKAIGIDYSLNSPAVCIASGDLSFKNCKFYYISSKKKYIGKFDNITGTEYPEWSDPIERFSKISQWVHTSLKSYGDMELFGGKTVVHLEGYSYGSKGQAIFQIAENCGILKYTLLESKINHYKNIGKPNCKYVSTIIDGNPKVFLVVIKNIKKNEEILANYNFNI